LLSILHASAYGPGDFMTALSLLPFLKPCYSHAGNPREISIKIFGVRDYRGSAREALRMASRVARISLALLCTIILSGPAMAQGRGSLDYLQKEPLTLFDIGMKGLRRLALNTLEKIADKPDMMPTSSVRYMHATGTIEISFKFKTKIKTNSIEQLRRDCIEIRRDAILKMFNIGLTDYGGPLSIKERIRRRIGIQFAHEPIDSITEFLALGEQLEHITYVEVTLTTTLPAVSVACRELATELIVK